MNLPPDLPNPPQRVVSLVPSLTESLFDLDLGDAVVGITDYCVHPAGAVAGLPRIGGTKNPRVREILRLRPDLVLANREENTRGPVESLQAAGVPVWVSHPQTVDQAIAVLRQMTGIFRRPGALARLEALETTVDRARARSRNRPPVRYFCPIWHSEGEDTPAWWMTFNRSTYCHDLLKLSGGENCFADRERRYPLKADLGLAGPQDPGDRDTRYPRVTLEEIRAARPELILLPDEPYPFDASHLEFLSEILPEVPAVRTGRVHCLDGSLVTWHGTRITKALPALSDLFYAD